MPRTSKAPQAFDEGQPIQINMEAVKSNQVKTIGYDPETKTLAVTFNYGSALYQYPEVSQETFDAFKAAESAGTFFGKHIKDLPFKKYRAQTVAA